MCGEEGVSLLGGPADGRKANPISSPGERFAVLRTSSFKKELFLETLILLVIIWSFCVRAGTSTIYARDRETMARTFG